MKIALIMNDNSYPGREYLGKLESNGLNIDVVCIGKNDEISFIENSRCGNLWCPEKQSKLMNFHNFYFFKNLKSNELISFLEKSKYDIGIQGGTGILKKNIINKFKLGIVNFHPGLLPMYRGCSAPEWQLYEKNKIISTCHLVDEGIDTGMIIDTMNLNVSYDNYHSFRASIYPETAKFVLKIINHMIEHNGFKNLPVKQNENHARYLKYIGDDIINEMKKNFFKFL